MNKKFYCGVVVDHLITNYNPQIHCDKDQLEPNDIVSIINPWNPTQTIPAKCLSPKERQAVDLGTYIIGIDKAKDHHSEKPIINCCEIGMSEAKGLLFAKQGFLVNVAMENMEPAKNVILPT